MLHSRFSLHRSPKESQAFSGVNTAYSTPVNKYQVLQRRLQDFSRSSKSEDSFPSHLPRETDEVAIPESFQQRIESGELMIKRYEITETLKSIPSKLVGVQYLKPLLPYKNDPECELATEEEANLGETPGFTPRSLTT